MNRGVEIEGAVADGPQSVIQEQVTNGLAVRMAVLALIHRHIAAVTGAEVMSPPASRGTVVLEEARILDAHGACRQSIHLARARAASRARARNPAASLI